VVDVRLCFWRINEMKYKKPLRPLRIKTTEVGGEKNLKTIILALKTLL
jgi:hypothetical protein